MSHDIEREALEYRWTVGYDRQQEFDKNPEWTDELRQETYDAPSGWYRDITRVFVDGKKDSVYILTDTCYDLMNVR